VRKIFTVYLFYGDFQKKGVLGYRIPGCQVPKPFFNCGGKAGGIIPAKVGAWGR